MNFNRSEPRVYTGQWLRFCRDRLTFHSIVSRARSYRQFVTLIQLDAIDKDSFDKTWPGVQSFFLIKFPSPENDQVVLSPLFPVSPVFFDYNVAQLRKVNVDHHQFTLYRSYERCSAAPTIRHRSRWMKAQTKFPHRAQLFLAVKRR